MKNTWSVFEQRLLSLRWKHVPLRQIELDSKKRIKFKVTLDITSGGQVTTMIGWPSKALFITFVNKDCVKMGVPKYLPQVRVLTTQGTLGPRVTQVSLVTTRKMAIIQLGVTQTIQVTPQQTTQGDQLFRNDQSPRDCDNTTAGYPREAMAGGDSGDSGSLGRSGGSGGCDDSDELSSDDFGNSSECNGNSCGKMKKPNKHKGGSGTSNHPQKKN